MDEINKKIASLNTNNKEILNNDQESTKLKLKIQNLTELLQQTSKFTHYLFLSKLRDKQQEIDTIKNSYENQLMRAEDLIVLEKNTLILEYEDQINILNLNMNEMEVKLTESQRNNDGEKLKKELKNKTDLLKLNEEKIRSLNDIRSSLNKEVQEQKEKILNYEKKIKIEHTEVLSKIHDLHKTETDKYKARIKNLEADFFNKSSELEKLNRQISEILKENRNKTEEIDKKTNESNILLQSNLKLKEDIQKLTNRLENLDIMISNRTSEIQNITKLNKELNFEKNSLNSENQHIRMQLVEFQNKGQKAIEALRIIELEKENLKSKNNKAKGEIEKKQIEINNLIKQIDLLNNQQKSLDRVCESQQQEKEKLNQLNDELTKKQVELNIYETKVEIFEADLDNKSQELEFLQNDLTSAKEEKEELRKEIEGLESQLNEERMSYNLLNQNLNDFKMINEHFQAEQEILEQKNQEIEICSKALQLKYNELIAKVANYDELTTKLSKNELELKEMSKKQIDLKEEKEKFERKIEETLFILCQKEGEIQKISSENDQQCIKIKDLYIEKENISKELNEKFIMLQNQENKNQDLFNELTLQENLYKEEIQSLTKEMNELRSSFDNIMKEITYLKEENHKLLEQSHNKSDIFDKEDKYVKGNEKEEKFATEQKEKMIDLERDNSYFEKQFETTKQVKSLFILKKLLKNE